MNKPYLYLLLSEVLLSSVIATLPLPAIAFRRQMTTPIVSKIKASGTVAASRPYFGGQLYLVNYSDQPQTVYLRVLDEKVGMNVYSVVETSHTWTIGTGYTYADGVASFFYSIFDATAERNKAGLPIFPGIPGATYIAKTVLAERSSTDPLKPPTALVPWSGICLMTKVGMTCNTTGKTITSGDKLLDPAAHYGSYIFRAEIIVEEDKGAVAGTIIPNVQIEDDLKASISDGSVYINGGRPF